MPDGGILDILSAIDMRVNAGEAVAILGPSGSGKSTAAGLAASFRHPTRGTVRIDGHDLATVKLGSYRDKLGVVLQDEFLFEGTIREHILLAKILGDAWHEGRSLDLAGLIRAIQSPPFDRIGVMDVDSFFPAKERFELAMSLNNLLASPGFETWMSGVPIDIAGNGNPF